MCYCILFSSHPFLFFYLFHHVFHWGGKKKLDNNVCFHRHCKNFLVLSFVSRCFGWHVIKGLPGTSLTPAITSLPSLWRNCLQYDDISSMAASALSLLRIYSLRWGPPLYFFLFLPLLVLVRSLAFVAVLLLLVILLTSLLYFFFTFSFLLCISFCFFC